MTIGEARSDRPWERLGLRILPDSPRSLGFAIIAGLAFGAYVALADTLIFHSVVPASQSMSGAPILQRFMHFIPPVLFDEIAFRLVAMSAVAWLLVALAGRRDWCFRAAIVFVAFVAYPAFHSGYLASLSFTPLVVSREILLHGIAGLLWGHLYWKHGWLAALAGHVAAHLSLEPMLGLL
jgi:hypothetical protein